MLVEPLENRLLLAADMGMEFIWGQACVAVNSDAPLTVAASEVQELILTQEFDKPSQSRISEPPALLDSDTSGPAEIVGSFIYHPNSIFADSGPDSAIDHSRQLAAEGPTSQLLTLDHLLNSSGGITGVGFDFQGLAGVELTESDFQFQMSPTGNFDEALNAPFSWQTAPNPESITVQPLTDSPVSRVRMEWSNGSIENRWLRITILATSNTGLLSSRAFYVGHLQGKTQDSSSAGEQSGDGQVFEVSLADGAPIREGVGSLAAVENGFDMNKDGVVSFQDLLVVGQAVGNQLTSITIPPEIASAPVAMNQPGDSPVDGNPSIRSVEIEENRKEEKEPTLPPEVHAPSISEIVGSFVYHRDSAFSDVSISESLDTGKFLAQEDSESQTLGFSNLINGDRGIGGVVFDIANLAAAEVNIDDFSFQMSPQGAFSESDNPPSQWISAPAPELIAVDPADVNQISRIRIEWPDNAIMNRWLRITVQASPNTGLVQPQVFYLGHLLGKSTNWLIDQSETNPSGAFELHLADLLTIRENVGNISSVDNVFDINKDGVISFQDLQVARSALGTKLSNITIPASSNGDTVLFNSPQESLTRKDGSVPLDSLIEREREDQQDESVDSLRKSSEPDSLVSKRIDVALKDLYSSERQALLIGGKL